MFVTIVYRVLSSPPQVENALKHISLPFGDSPTVVKTYFQAYQDYAYARQEANRSNRLLFAAALLCYTDVNFKIPHTKIAILMLKSVSNCERPPSEYVRMHPLELKTMHARDFYAREVRENAADCPEHSTLSRENGFSPSIITKTNYARADPYFHGCALPQNCSLHR